MLRTAQKCLDRMFELLEPGAMLEATATTSKLLKSGQPVVRLKIAI